MKLRFSLVALLTLVLVGGAAVSAQAVHWPLFGGDAGRSGNQPVDEGTVPVKPVYSVTGAGKGNVRTSVVTTTTQLLAYGTENEGAGLDGNVHLRRLADGVAANVPDDGIDIDDGANDTDTFGPDNSPASVSFADTSTAGTPGQLYVLHNDDAGLELAQIDEATGQRRDFNPGTPEKDDRLVENGNGQLAGATIESSPVMTGPVAGTGDRSLFFVVRFREGTTNLVKVPITKNASSFTSDVGEPQLGQTGTKSFITRFTSPTIAFLRNGDGKPEAFVLLGTEGGNVVSHAVDDLAPGPGASGLGGIFESGSVQTPAVPVTPSGNTPGAAGTGVATTPAIYVTADTGTNFTPALQQLTGEDGSPRVLRDDFDADGSARVFRLAQRPDDPATPDVDESRRLTAARSDAIDGAPAPAMAVSAETVGEDTGEGELIVTTSLATYVLDPGLTRAVAIDSANTGDSFANTTAAASGDVGYVTRDNGSQVVFDLEGPGIVPVMSFTQVEANAGATTSLGQPSISRGFIQFASDKGLFVYRNTDDTPPTVALEAPLDNATVSGTVTLSARAFDIRAGIASTTFRIGATPIGTDTTGIGIDVAAPGALYSVDVDTTKMPNGTYPVAAVAADRSGLNAESAERSITISNAGPPGPALGAVIPKRIAPKLTANVTPKKDATTPRTFKVSGRLILPAGIARSVGCLGKATVLFKRGTLTISTRRATIRKDCSYSRSVTFSIPSRLRRAKRLRVLARYGGSQLLFPVSAPSRSATIR